MDSAIAVWLSGVLSVIGLGLATLAAKRAVATDLDASRIYLPLGLLAYALTPYAWDFATSGLEIGLAIAWLGACGLIIERLLAGTPLRPVWAVLLGLGPLVRPDLGLMSAVFLGAAVVAAPPHHRHRGRGRLGSGARRVRRAGYFGLLVPTTALAKEGLRPRPGQGLDYLWSSLRAYLTFVLVAIVGLVWVRSDRPSHRPSSALGSACLARHTCSM